MIDEAKDQRKISWHNSLISPIHLMVHYTHTGTVTTHSVYTSTITASSHNYICHLARGVRHRAKGKKNICADQPGPPIPQFRQ